MSANTGILTYNSGVYEILNTYYSPTVSIPSTGKKLAPLYCFLSKVEPWQTEEVPPVPQQTQKYLKQVFKNMFVAKQITTNDMSPVIQRIDWTAGETYDYYRDDVDMFALNEDGTVSLRFYIKNRFDQVFKCLWNNNDGESTVEPYFEPGTFNANQIFQGADNYKWKYMYTITTGTKIKYMDDNWMPVPVGNTAPNPLESTKTWGSIDVINITDGGTNYDTVIAPITITITGDGVGASADASVSGGIIRDIVVANTGYNYTYANVSISSTQGSGANAVVYTSPVGGHGFNPMSELGARHLMITANFNKDESGNLPTDIDFRQIGLVFNPYVKFGSGYNQANASVYKLTTDFVVSPGFGAYAPDEIVYQSNDGSLENAYFTATVLSFDSTYNTVKLINTQGTPVENTLLVGKTTLTSRVGLQLQETSFVPFSGYMIYLENREPTQRSADGSEQFKLVLGY